MYRKNKDVGHDFRIQVSLTSPSPGAQCPSPLVCDHLRCVRRSLCALDVRELTMIGVFVVFRKHYVTHEPRVLCEYPRCPRGQKGKGFAHPREMYEHAWVHHRRFAAREGYRNYKCVCEVCGKELTKKGNLKRHKGSKSCHSRPR